MYWRPLFRAEEPEDLPSAYGCVPDVDGWEKKPLPQCFRKEPDPSWHPVGGIDGDTGATAPTQNFPHSAFDAQNKAWGGHTACNSTARTT